VWRDENAKAWTRVRYTVIALWIVAVARLFIADVWDESGALVAFRHDNGQRALQIIGEVLKTPLPFWRPVPTILVALAIHAIPAPAVAWRLLRMVNVAAVLTSLWMLLAALRAWAGRSERREALFTFAYLFSAGAILVATWFANVFDASAMLLIAAGILLIAQGRFLTAGLVFGVAFFFKETAAMTLPLLLLLLAVRRIRFGEAVTVAIPTVLAGGLYFTLRGLIIPFGSAADTHQFHVAMLVPSTLGLIESFWRETLWGHPTILGYCAFLFSLIAMRGWRARLAFAGYVAFTSLLYLEMFTSYQSHELIRHLMFVPRLYFIPGALVLFIFALDQRWWAIAVLAVPLFAGAAGTYFRYERFQRSYQHIYRYAKTAPKPVRVDSLMKALHDPSRGLDIGDFPDAPVRLDSTNGQLVPRR
jgi:hypothetical protein